MRAEILARISSRLFARKIRPEFPPAYAGGNKVARIDSWFRYQTYSWANENGTRELSKPSQKLSGPTFSIRKVGSDNLAAI